MIFAVAFFNNHGSYDFVYFDTNLDKYTLMAEMDDIVEQCNTNSQVLHRLIDKFKLVSKRRTNIIFVIRPEFNVLTYYTLQDAYRLVMVQTDKSLMYFKSNKSCNFIKHLLLQSGETLRAMIIFPLLVVLDYI